MALPAPEVRYDPGDAWVHEEIWTFWSENRQAAFRRMRRETTWDEFVADLTAQVRDEAHDLMAAGEMGRRAWRLAIRTEVMGMSED